MRGKIIEGFKDSIFPSNYNEVWEEQTRYKTEEKEKLNNIKYKNGLIDYKRLNGLINAKERDK